jgi:hypothetical protein
LDARLESAIRIPLSNLTLDEVDDRITEFQEDPIIRNAVENGMNLAHLASEVKGELEQIEQLHIKDCTLCEA